MQLLLELKDEREKDFLLKLLGQFEFVRVIGKTVSSTDESEKNVEDGLVTSAVEGDDFFAEAGMLSHWTVSEEELKEKAWGIRKK